MASSSSSSIGPHGSSSSGHATGFKVYGSVFKVSSRYQFLNPLGKGSYGIVWYVARLDFLVGIDSDH